MVRKRRGSPNLKREDLIRILDEQDYRCLDCNMRLITENGSYVDDSIKQLNLYRETGNYDFDNLDLIISSSEYTLRYRKARSLMGENHPSNIGIVCLECGGEKNTVSIRVSNHVLSQMDDIIEKGKKSERPYSGRTDFIRDCIQTRIKLENLFSSKVYFPKNRDKHWNERELVEYFNSVIQAHMEIELIDHPRADMMFETPEGKMIVEIKSSSNYPSLFEN
jgi:hypothetical protein